MEEINIDLRNAHREAVAYLLNLLLADEQVLYTKTRNYHWNVRGMHFHSLHRLFEEQYQELALAIDSVAERIRALGHYAIGSMRSYIELTRLTETNHVDGRAEIMLQNLLNDHESIIRTLRRDLSEEAEKYRDMGTSDFATDLLEKHEKMAWMIRAYLN